MDTLEAGIRQLVISECQIQIDNHKIRCAHPTEENVAASVRKECAKYRKPFKQAPNHCKLWAPGDDKILIRRLGDLIRQNTEDLGRTSTAIRSRIMKILEDNC